MNLSTRRKMYMTIFYLAIGHVEFSDFGTFKGSNHPRIYQSLEVIYIRNYSGTKVVAFLTIFFV